MPAVSLLGWHLVSAHRWSSTWYVHTLPCKSLTRGTAPVQQGGPTEGCTVKSFLEQHKWIPVCRNGGRTVVKIPFLVLSPLTCFIYVHISTFQRVWPPPCGGIGSNWAKHCASTGPKMQEIIYCCMCDNNWGALQPTGSGQAVLICRIL